MLFSLGNQPNTIFVFFAIIILIAVVRLRRGLRGIRFSNRIFLVPILYVVLTIGIVFPMTLTQKEWMLAFGVIGFVIGIKISTDPNLFFNEGSLFYKRSGVILVIWLVALIFRLVLEFFFPITGTLVDFAIGGALVFTLGIILAERFVIYRKGREMQERSGYS